MATIDPAAPPPEPCEDHGRKKCPHCETETDNEGKITKRGRTVADLDLVKENERLKAENERLAAERDAEDDADDDPDLADDDGADAGELDDDPDDSGEFIPGIL